ncbi:MAG: hypothetical protein JSS34_08090 [Proteobacteria bacterium]|nr:hypothetical protein [Pseudomonadota bacterium]
MELGCFLVSQEADFFAKSSELNEPVLFSFVTQGVFHHKLNDLFKGLKTSEQKNAFKALKNKEGLTVLQYIQKLLVERRIAPTQSNSYGWSSFYSEEEYKQASYLPFIELFGVYPFSLTNYLFGEVDPLLFERNLKWLKDLESLESFEEWKTHLLRCPSSAFFQLMRPRLETHDVIKAEALASSSRFHAEEQWKAALTQADQAQNETEVQKLLSNAPLSLLTGGFENPALEEKVKVVIDKNGPLRDELSDRWKEEFSKQHKSRRFKDLASHLSSLSLLIYFVEDSSVKLLRDKISAYSINYEEIYKSLKKSEEDWTKITLANLKSSPSIDDFRSRLQEAPNDGARQKLFFPLLQDSFVKYLPTYLEIVFPNREPLASIHTLSHPTDRHTQLTYHNLFLQNPLTAKTLFANIGAFGENILKTLSEPQLKNVFSCLSPEEVALLFSNLPDATLLYNDNARDIFPIALQCLPSGPWKQEFCLRHKDRLKEMDLQSRSLYVSYLFLDENLSLLDALVERDPNFLKLATPDGLTLSNLRSVDMVSAPFKKWIDTQVIKMLAS